jgi:hypothetical protein
MANNRMLGCKMRCRCYNSWCAISCRALYYDRLKKFMNNEQNLLQVIILDGHIIQSIRLLGCRRGHAILKDVIKIQLLFPIS